MDFCYGRYSHSLCGMRVIMTVKIIVQGLFFWILMLMFFLDGSFDNTGVCCCVCLLGHYAR